MSLLWKMIENSKNGKEYCEPHEQYQHLFETLIEYDEKSLSLLEEEWEDEIDKIRSSPEFLKLHWSKGGIINMEHKQFEEIFPYWMLIQGEEFLKNFNLLGAYAVMNYIFRNDVSSSDYQLNTLSQLLGKAKKQSLA